LDELKRRTFSNIKTAFNTNRDLDQDPNIRRFMPLENLTSYESFRTRIVDELNRRYISYVKARNLNLLKGMTLDIMNEISLKAMEIYQRTSNPFQCIEEINRLWEQKQTTLAQNANLGDDDMIQIFNATKQYVEEELGGFRKMIFGDPYTASIKINVLRWSNDTTHLAADGYPDLHTLTIVKCPGCGYPWGNHGMCKNRTCLFCLTSFNWNNAAVATRQDWDLYDYEPAYVPQVGETNLKFKTPKTLLVNSLK